MDYSYDSIIKFTRNSRYNDFSCLFLSWCYFEKHILRDKNINYFSIEPWMDIDPKNYPAFVVKLVL